MPTRFSRETREKAEKVRSMMPRRIAPRGLPARKKKALFRSGGKKRGRLSKNLKKGRLQRLMKRSGEVSWLKEMGSPLISGRKSSKKLGGQNPEGNLLGGVVNRRPSLLRPRQSYREKAKILRGRTRTIDKFSLGRDINQPQEEGLFRSRIENPSKGRYKIVYVRQRNERD